MKIAERHSERTLSRKEFLDLMDQEFAAGRALPLTVTGSSMEPFLRNLRDQAILVSAENRPLRPGRYCPLPAGGRKFCFAPID